MIVLLLSLVVMGSFLLGRYEERARHEDEELQALERMNRRAETEQLFNMGTWRW